MSVETLEQPVQKTPKIDKVITARDSEELHDQLIDLLETYEAAAGHVQAGPNAMGRDVYAFFTRNTCKVLDVTKSQVLPCNNFLIEMPDGAESLCTIYRLERHGDRLLAFVEFEQA